jgi:hypothetical protein
MAAIMKGIVKNQKEQMNDTIDQVFNDIMGQIDTRRNKDIIIFKVPKTHNNNHLSKHQLKSVFKRIHTVISKSNSRLVQLRWEYHHYDYRVVSPCYSFDIDAYDLLSFGDYDLFAVKTNGEKTNHFNKKEGFIMSDIISSMLS